MVRKIMKNSYLHKQILIVNCYAEEYRIPVRRWWQHPQPMAPVYLAGMFSKHLCEVKIYDEEYNGVLECSQICSWPDMLVLSGLTAAFDRMLQLTAYVRTKNPNAIIVAGGAPIKILWKYIKKKALYGFRGVSLKG